MPGLNTIQFFGKVIDRANRQDILRLKEALHIRLTNKDERFNRDVGMVVPDCWVATINHSPSTHVCTCVLTLFIIIYFLNLCITSNLMKASVTG